MEVSGMVTVSIEKLDYGYLVRKDGGMGNRFSAAATSLEEAFRRALFQLEGRSPHFGGSAYGDVRVLDKKSDE